MKYIYRLNNLQNQQTIFYTASIPLLDKENQNSSNTYRSK